MIWASFRKESRQANELLIEKKLIQTFSTDYNKKV